MAKPDQHSHACPLSMLLSGRPHRMPFVVAACMQLGWRDMRLPIMYTMCWPGRVNTADYNPTSRL
jgi:hypothetical protein